MFNPPVNHNFVSRVLLFLALALFASTQPSLAQTVIKIHDFNPRPYGTSPTEPVVLGSDGDYYGCSSVAVFRIDPNGNPAVLHRFLGPEGDTPTGLIEASDGNYYGTTIQGGPLNSGTIFRITPAGVLTTLHSFSVDDGSEPSGAMVFGIDGNLYGTTTTGGANSAGTIFKITLSGNFTLLHSFDPVNEGSSPIGLVLGLDHDFYGVTQSGSGALTNGTVYRYTHTGVLQTLHVLDGAGDGSTPSSTLIQARDGNFYGTAQGAGASTDGSVFRVSTGGTYVNIHSFNGADGSHPKGGLVVGPDGVLYGTTSASTGDGSGTGEYGTLYKISLSGTFTTLHVLSKSEGAGSSASMIVGADGAFYGTCSWGGPFGFGSVFRSTLAGDVTVLTG